MAIIEVVSGDDELGSNREAWRSAESGPRGRALLFLSQNRPDRAAAALRDALNEDPNDAWAHAMLAGCLIDLDQPKRAVEHAESALALEPNAAYIHSTLAAAHAARGRLGSAHDAAQQARQLDPNDADIAAQLASIFIAQGMPKQGMREARRGLSLDPQHLGCRGSLADALFAIGKADEARQIVRKILALNPELSSAHRFQGMDALTSSDAIAAERHLTEALRLDPEAAAKDQELRDGYRRSLMLSFAPYRWMTRLRLPPGGFRRVAAFGAICIGITLLVLAGLLAAEEGFLYAGLTIGLVLIGIIALFIAMPLVAEVWVTRFRPEARVLGPEARGRANVIVGGVATLLALIAALVAYGPSLPVFVAVGVVAFTMPLSMAWAIRHVRPRAAKVWPTLLAVVGIAAIAHYLAGWPGESGDTRSLASLCFVACYFSFTLPELIDNYRARRQ